MKIAIMQPYFMPYLGYFQLIKEVDLFVLFDDVNYIKKGWINRNRIKINGEESMFTIPLVKASQNKRINEILISDAQNSKNQLYKKIHNAYRKSDKYDEVNEIIKKAVMYNEESLDKYIKNALEEVCKYLDIKTKFIISSEIEKNNELKGQEKIIEICKLLKADEYINAIGGVQLYDYKKFNENDIKLKFIKADENIPTLSIIDVLYNEKKETIKEYIDMYSLIKGEELEDVNKNI
ncbi:MAG: WbqC family protein [Clostridiales bacterium]|nr:WbqC family protein [Clostridiales bacterium]